MLPVPGGDKEWYLFTARAGLLIGVASRRRDVSLNTIARGETRTNRPAPPPFSPIMARQRRWFGCLARSGRFCLRRSVQHCRLPIRKERQQAAHEQVSAERAKLAEAMDRMAEPIVQIAQIVGQIDRCDREIGRLNATSVRLGHIRPVLSGTAPALAALFGDAIVWDAFIAVAGLQSPEVVSCGAGEGELCSQVFEISRRQNGKKNPEELRL